MAYAERFPVGMRVRIAGRANLDRFRHEWHFHHPLAPEQLDWADTVTTVREVSFYHGGDALYSLEDVPGCWHEACLAAGDEAVI